MNENPPVNDLLGARGTAAMGVFFVCGPGFFMLWIYVTGIKNSDNLPLNVWAVPIAATVFCTLAVLLLPDRIVRFLGKVFGWIPYV